MDYIIIISSLIFLLVSLKDLRFSLGLIFLGLPLYQIRFELFNIPLTLLEVWIIIFTVVWLINNPGLDKFKAIFKKIGKWKWPCLLWLLAGVLSIIISPDLRSALGFFKAYFFEPILLFLIGMDIIESKRDLLILIIFGLILGVILSLWAIFQKFLGGGIMSLEKLNSPQVWRATGPFPHPNFLGLLLGPIALISSSFLFSFSKELIFKITGVLFLIIVGIALFLAKSEGAILGLLAGLFIMTLYLKPKITLITLVIILLIVFSVPALRGYFYNKASFTDISSQLRLNIWKGSLDLLSENVLLGVGLGGYEKLIPGIQKPYFDKNTKKLISIETHPYPHNLFLTIWSELGILGLFLFSWILIRFFYFGIKKIQKVQLATKIQILGLIAAMVSILVHGLVDTPYFKNDLSILFWFLILFMVFLQNKKEFYGEVA